MKRLISILCCAFGWLAAFANAEADGDSLSMRLHLDEVTVTARKQAAELMPPQSLSGTQLQQLNVLNVADALRYFSGIQIKDYGGVGGIKTVNIRSMGSQHVGVYYDGLPLDNAQNGTVDLGRFSMDEMERVLLYNGQKTDLLQSARETGCAGSIYLESRRPYFNAGKSVRARVKMRAGSFALANPSFSVDINMGQLARRKVDGLYLNINGEYIYSDGRYPFRYRRLTANGATAYDTTAVRHNGDINAVRAEASLHHYYSATGLWHIQGYTYWSNRGIPGAIVNNVWYNGERQTDRNSFVQGRWQDMFFNRWALRLNAKYANDYTHYRNLDPRTLPLDNTYLQQELYVSLAQKITVFSWWNMALAYDFQYNTLNRQQTSNGATEHFARKSHWLSLSTAFNVQDYLRLQVSALMTRVGDMTHVTPAAFLRLSPFASCRSPFVQGLCLVAFYKQSYRYPTFNDLYYTEVGAADLRPEWARQHDVGLEYTFSVTQADLTAKADYYYNRVTDKIIAFPKGQMFRWAMLNLGEVSIHGADISLSATVRLPLRFSLTPHVTYTYQRAVDITNSRDSYYGHQIPYIPLHSGSAVIGLAYQSRRGDDYGINYAFTYTGERYSQQENIPANYLPAWYTHDLTLFGEWHLYHHALRAQIEMNNLLGQDYEVVANYPMPKQNFRCTISLTY